MKRIVPIVFILWLINFNPLLIPNAAVGSTAMEFVSAVLTPVEANAQPPEGEDQELTTTVHDPKNPGDPWVVTTYHLPKETSEHFVARHQATVDAVRDALNEE